MHEFELAQAYVQRARVVYGTPRYGVLKQRIDALLEKLTQEQKESLQTQLDNPFEPPQRSVDDPYLSHPTVPAALKPFVSAPIQYFLTKILKLSKALIDYAKLFEEFLKLELDLGDNPSNQQVVQYLATDEYLNEFSLLYTNDAQDFHSLIQEYESVEKYLLIYQLLEVSFHLLLGHSTGYAFHYINRFVPGDIRVEYQEILELLPLLSKQDQEILDSDQSITFHFYSLTRLARKALSFVSYLSDEVCDHSNQYSQQTPLIFKLAIARFQKEAKDTLDMILALNLQFNPSLTESLVDCLDSLLFDDPISFYKDYVEKKPQISQLSEAYNLFLGRFPERFSEVLIHKLQDSSDESYPPFGIFPSFKMLSAFYEYGLKQGHEKSILVKFVYRVINEIKPTVPDRDDYQEFMRQIILEHTRIAGGTFSFMNISPTASDDELNKEANNTSVGNTQENLPSLPRTCSPLINYSAK